ncbi:hypothetical protein GCM10010193_59950 [Kitasatospora atroaurantiaca]|uniref:LPXTG-motif cell wall-anchored protein n=1 Tax=Kitasatospora atroaurantiaca TaxID=285545 RepID=A0A561EWT5_9ACTN|nr:LAETG motif-containing sortase-dependent surface protein [Kitasatospora atroaurantiaca]TWE20063.1 LPXTG-motif cell wall-anchored protein [Kitasatospora atroaurantiaca]
MARRISGGLVAAAAGLGVLAPLVLAGGASAHVPSWTVTCEKISVKLTSYDPKFQNSVSLTLDGEKLLDHQKFGEAFSQDFVVKPHTKDLKAVLTVVTDQDPKGDQGWTVTKTATIAPCPQTHSPSPSPSPSSSKPTVKPTTSKPVPSPSHTGPELASTGGGSNTPVIAGIGVGVIALGGGLVLLTRRRQSRRH